MGYRKECETVECVTSDKFESVLSSIEDVIDQLVDRLKDLRSDLA